MTATTSQRLKPYVPRLVIEWAEEAPEARHRRLEGTLAFVDISGFTAMCERLARKGKVGAEEVNDVLDLCFTHLLSVAYDFDGGVIKWGGDAVLLLFSGDDHAARACRAAVGMRRALRQFLRFRTSAGYVALRMSVGVHSGEFDFFLVGGSHRELIVTGPAATETVSMESIATAGEIAISPTTAAFLPSDVIGERKGEAFLLKGEPESPIVRAKPVEGIADEDLAPFVPVDIREHLLAGGGETEHRHVTVAFLQFKGTNAMLAAAGPDATAEALDQMIRTVQEATLAYGVSFHETDIDADGGKVLLVAGAPRSSGHDEERMLRTLRRIAETSLDLPIRIGVNSGDVFCGDFGPPYRRSYSIKGDAVNLAARIMGKAELRQVLATEPVLAKSETEFDVIPLEPFMVKGKKHPVHAFAVGGIVGPKQAPEQTALPLVGRELEMTILTEAMEFARSEGGRLVEVVAEPGMGKSRILEELRTRAGDAPILGATCDPYEASTPYHPFRALLRDAYGIPADATAVEGGRLLAQRVQEAAPGLLPWLPLLAVPLDVEVLPTAEAEQLELEFKKAKLEEATASLLRILFPGPTLLSFEDIHWMDGSSSDLLHHIVSTLEETRWLVCVTRRDQNTGFVALEGAATVTVRLAPLSAEDAAALATAASEASPLAPHALVALAERSGGNPLFLQELVSASHGAEAGEALPDSVEALLAAQIDRLSGPDRSLLRSAAVLGTAFPLDLLEEMLEDRASAIRDPDTWLRLADYLLLSDGGLRFRHALIRDAAYEGLPYRRREQLHEKVGTTIERANGPASDEQAEILSMHFFHAHVNDKAWRYSRLAGERARSKFANIEAAGFYRRALSAGRGLPDLAKPEMADVFRSLGDVSDRAGQYGDAAAAYRSARKLLTGDRLAEAELLLKEGIIRDRSGRYTQALGWYRRGLTTLDPVDSDNAADSARAQLAVWYAAARRQQGKLKEAIKWCLRAIEHAQTGGNKEALAHAYRLLDWIYTELGSPERASYRGLALPLYEELGDLGGQADVLNQLGMDSYFEGRWSEAIDYYHRGEEVAEKTGDAVTAAHGTNNIAEILSDQGHLDAAEPLFQQAYRVWRAARFSLGVPFAISNLGRLAARAGRFEEAHERLAEAATQFRDIGAEGQALEAEARIAEAYLLAGHADQALELATRTLQLATALGGLTVLRAMLHRLRGWALMPDDTAAARRALEESLALGRSVQADFEVAQTLVALAEIEGQPDAGEHEKEGRSILDRLEVVSLPEIPLPWASRRKDRAAGIRTA